MAETDEGMVGSPMDAVEIAHAMAGAAGAAWTMFGRLQDEGFTADQAMRATCAMLHGMAGGKLQ